MIQSTIPIDLIDFEGTRQYSQSEVDELVQSINTIGLQQPIRVSSRGERFKLIDGYRRILSLKRLGLVDVPAVIVECCDYDVLLQQTVASEARVETKPEEYARQLQKILAHYPEMTLEDLASKLCRSPEWLRERLKLVKQEANVGL